MTTFRSKLIIRGLPPTWTHRKFEEFISSWNDDINYYNFHPGKMPQTYSSKPLRKGKAFVNFTSPDPLLNFVEKYNIQPIVEESGAEYNVSIEFAPFQEIPSSAEVDPFCNTLDDDEEFKNFIKSILEQTPHDKETITIEEQLESMLNKERKLNPWKYNKELLKETPLLEHLKKQSSDTSILKVSEKISNEKAKKKKSKNKKKRSEGGNKVEKQQKESKQQGKVRSEGVKDQELKKGMPPTPSSFKVVDEPKSSSTATPKFKILSKKGPDSQDQQKSDSNTLKQKPVSPDPERSVKNPSPQQDQPIITPSTTKTSAVKFYSSSTKNLNNPKSKPTDTFNNKLDRTPQTPPPTDDHKTPSKPKVVYRTGGGALSSLNNSKKT